MRKVVDDLMKVIQRIMGALLVCAVLLVLVQVFSRGWFNRFLVAMAVSSLL